MWFRCMSHLSPLPTGQQKGNVVEAEASSFLFNFKVGKCPKTKINNLLLGRGLNSSDAETRQAALDLYMMLASGSYTKNQLLRRENKFLDKFRSGKNIPVRSQILEDTNVNNLEPKEKALKLDMGLYQSHSEAIQLYNKALIEYCHL